MKIEHELTTAGTVQIGDIVQFRITSFLTNSISNGFARGLILDIKPWIQNRVDTGSVFTALEISPAYPHEFGHEKKTWCFYRISQIWVVARGNI